MGSRRVSVEELKQVMALDFDRLVQKIADAMNGAKDGRIISDTEELVRDANAEFRQQVYGEALRLLQSKQEAFSPSARRAQEQGPTTDHPTDSQRTPVRQ